MHNNIIVRLVTYYLAVLLALGGLFAAFPVLGDYLSAERARQGGRASLELDRLPEAVPATPAPAGPTGLLNPERTVPVLLSLLIAFLVVLPVVWVYGWTRPRRRYNQTFAQTLLVVPIAITLVVFLVKGSLALAFSLAGIVAAVRFRTTLDEPLDAVYLFLVIGTGLAAGVQLLFVAFIASVVFNAVVLAVWRLDVCAQPAVLSGWYLVPAEAEAQVQPAGGAVRSVPGPGAEEGGDLYNTRLCLHVTHVEEAQRFAAALIEERAKKWQVAEVTPGPDGSSVLEFDLRLKKSVDLAAFVREIEQGVPHVTKVELLRTKSKKPNT
jgi:Domain of unknown function (DUF4956)